MSRRLYLEVTGGKDLGRRFDVGTTNTIGREKTDIVLDRDDTLISRMHGVLEVTTREQVAVYTDHSAHGTTLVRDPASRAVLAEKKRSGAKDAPAHEYVNGRSGSHVRSVIVEPGDALVLGKTTLVLREVGPAVVATAAVVPAPAPAPAAVTTTAAGAAGGGGAQGGGAGGVGGAVEDK